MKAKQYAEIFIKDYPTLGELKAASVLENRPEGYQSPVHRLLLGFQGEIAQAASKAANAPYESVAQEGFIADLKELNHKFRVVRGMVRDHYGLNILDYDGMSTFIRKVIGDELFKALPGLEEALK